MLKRTGGVNIKYTTLLPQVCIDELRRMADKKEIPSVNQGIRAAVADFLMRINGGNTSLVCTKLRLIKRLSRAP